jgi:putative GTP pyrophosphokinase
VALSKTQVDRLGDRLKEGEPSEADLRLLDEYRRSFGEVYDFVVSAIRNDLHLEPNRSAGVDEVDRRQITA